MLPKQAIKNMATRTIAATCQVIHSVVVVEFDWNVALQIQLIVGTTKHEERDPGSGW